MAKEIRVCLLGAGRGMGILEIGVKAFEEVKAAGVCDLDPERLRSALRLFAERGCAGVFMHGRTGLEVEYLSEDWWDRIGVIVEECERLGLKAWIYDEYNWPSGPAGGKALAGRPDFMMHYLEFTRVVVDKKSKGVTHRGQALAAFKVGNVVSDVSDQIVDGRYRTPQDFTGEVLIFYEDVMTDATTATTNAPWVSEGNGYLDLMNPEAEIGRAHV